MSASMAQLAFVNDLYNQLEVPYSRRKKPTTSNAASLLIDDLKAEVESMKNEGGYHGE